MKCYFRNFFIISFVLSLVNTFFKMFFRRIAQEQRKIIYHKETLHVNHFLKIIKNKKDSSYIQTGTIFSISLNHVL